MNKNLIIVGSGRILLGALSFINIVAIARFSGVDAVAKYGFSLTLVLVISLAAQFGLPQTIIKKIVENKNSKNSHDATEFTSLIIVSVASILVGTTLILLASINILPAMTKIVNINNYYCIAAWIFLYSLQSLFSEIYRGHGFANSAILFGGLFSTSFVSASLIVFGVLKYVITFEYIIFFTLTGLIFSNLLAFCILRNKKVIIYDGFSLVKPLCLSSAHNFLIVISSSLVMQSAALVINFSGSAGDVANFSTATRLNAALAMISSILAQTFSTKIANLSTIGNYSELNIIAKKICNLSILTAIPVFVVLFFYTDNVIIILFGDNFIGSSLYIKIMIVGFFLNSVTGLRSQFIIQSGNQKYLSRVAVTGGIGSVVLCFFAGEFFDIKYVAVVAQIVFVVMGILELYIAKKYAKITSLPDFSLVKK